MTQCCAFLWHLDYGKSDDNRRLKRRSVTSCRDSPRYSDEQRNIGNQDIIRRSDTMSRYRAPPWRLGAQRCVGHRGTICRPVSLKCCHMIIGLLLLNLIFSTYAQDPNTPLCNTSFVSIYIFFLFYLSICVDLSFYFIFLGNLGIIFKL